MNDVTKLPKWAQDHIRDLQRQRDAAVEALDRYCDDQTDSGVWTDELVCDKAGGPSHRQKFIQVNAVSMRIKSANPKSPISGVVEMRQSHDRENTIILTFGDCLIRCKVSNQIELVHVKDAWSL